MLCHSSDFNASKTPRNTSCMPARFAIVLISMRAKLDARTHYSSWRFAIVLISMRAKLWSVGKHKLNSFAIVLISMRAKQRPRWWGWRKQLCHSSDFNASKTGRLLAWLCRPLCHSSDFNASKTEIFFYFISFCFAIVLISMRAKQTIVDVVNVISFAIVLISMRAKRTMPLLNGSPSFAIVLISMRAKLQSNFIY